jgi:hypothetical protein
MRCGGGGAQELRAPTLGTGRGREKVGTVVTVSFPQRQWWTGRPFV